MPIARHPRKCRTTVGRRCDANYIRSTVRSSDNAAAPSFQTPPHRQKRPVPTYLQVDPY
jgi:hypothetical protein